ncbi:MAG: hypothetical protein GY701_21320, partial [Sulfitobacter sp.]|nr:hypothetical protein [Sulfitobacter sp.]
LLNLFLLSFRHRIPVIRSLSPMFASKHLVSIAVIALVYLIAAPAGQAAESERRLLIFEQADYGGFDYRTLKEVSLEECKDSCLEDRQCKALTYNTDVRWCFLKSDFGPLASFSDAVAGRVVTGASVPDAETAIDLGFLPGDIAIAAARYGASFGESLNGGGFGHNLETAQTALRSGEPRTAAVRFQAALAYAEDSFSGWLGLAESLLQIKPKDYRERYRLPEDAGAAAFNAIKQAPDGVDQADALRLMAASLERRQIWRPAIETLKSALSVAGGGEKQASLQADYERLRAARGFRMLDYSVDSDAAEPRACVQFSEDLRERGVNYTDFLLLDGGVPPAVTRDLRQLCIDGLKHGRRYRLTLRAGLPSDRYETLAEGIDLKLYIRDRSPTVRFTGQNYVLPRHGARGIPLVSINADSARIEIYRIGDRSLMTMLRDDRVLHRLSGYDANDIAEQSGSRVWRGLMPIETRLNQEVVTAFPIDEVLSQPEPGTYVMVAQPGKGDGEEWEDRATQWFVISDLGLAAISGSDDGVHAFVRSLATAEPLAGVQFKLMARNNEILGTATSDLMGHAHFAAGLARGSGGMAPAALVASTEQPDYAFLDLGRPGFDLTDRGVAGRPAAGPIDLFLYTERGVYRPGETVHVVTLARDARANALPGVPLTFVLLRPDGVEHLRRLSKDRGLGGHSLDIELDAGVRTGAWRIRTYADPQGEPLAETVFLVEDFIPERLDFTIEAGIQRARPGQPVPLSVAGRYLFGAPAANLVIEGEALLRPARDPFEGFTGYRFGLSDEPTLSTRAPLQGLAPTDGDGKARFDASLPDRPETTGLLEAQLVLRMREGSGRAVERVLTLPVAPAAPMIGIKPLFENDQVAEGGSAGFSVQGLGSDGLANSIGAADWQLIKLERHYEWYRLNGRWNYEPVTRTRRVDSGSLTITGQEPARLDVDVDWGRYRLEVFSGGNDGPLTSIEFNAGWYAANASTETPDNLEVSLDKAAYRSGETARLRLTPRFAGKALITVSAGKVIAMQAVDVPATGATVDLPVGDDWGAGAYVSAMLYRPMDIAAGHNPARAVGLGWLALNAGPRTLGVEMKLPELVRPQQKLKVPMKLTGLADGTTARVAVAAVDDGILNLTGYRAPQPEDWYFGQRRLGVEMRDLYARLINGLQGMRGVVRSGAGVGGGTLRGTPPIEKPVALFSGIVEVGSDGQAVAEFDLPQFNGTLRFMAVAWSETGVGQGSSELIVRDPVALTASLPRFLAPGDQSRLRLEMVNLGAAEQGWSLDVQSKGNILALKESWKSDVALPRGVQQVIEVPITAHSIGVATLQLRLSHADEPEINRELTLAVRPTQPPVTRSHMVTLKGGGDQLTLNDDLLTGLIPDSGAVSLAVSRGLLVDVTGLLDSLDRYPYGCAEQTTSRALPLLYLNQVAARAGLGTDSEIHGRVQKAVDRLRQFQDAGGNFGLWNPGGGNLWLNAYVTDFLSRAREQGYQVPEPVLGQALNRLENRLGYAGESGVAEGIAYALYVLARNARASIGDLRYYTDERLESFATPLAKAQLGGALALYGEQDRARLVFDAVLAQLDGQVGRAVVDRSDYGSSLRDGAAFLTIAAETAKQTAPLPRITALVNKLSRRHTSTQENAWLLLAAHAVMENDADMNLGIDGNPHRGRLLRRFTSLEQAAVTISNQDEQDIKAIITVSGIPAEPEPASAHGLTIKRNYYTLTGQRIDTAEVGQNERLLVLLEVSEKNVWNSQLLVADLLPGGFEIDNPRLVQGAEGMAWLKEMNLSTPSHTEFRDDRFMAAFERSPDSPRKITIAYIVRAVTPGVYAHPPALVEDMYRPAIAARGSLDKVRIIGPQPR